MNNQTYNEESKGVAMNIFAVLGFIAILLAGLWATVQLVKQISNLSFDFNKPEISMPTFGGSDKLATITNTETVNSGEGVDIAWTLGEDARNAEGSTLSFAYACKAGAYIKVLDADIDGYRAIPCNAPYPIKTTDTKFSMIPVLTNIDTAKIAYALTYTPTDGDTQVVNDTITISKNGSVAIKPAPTEVSEPKITIPAVTTPIKTKPAVVPQIKDGTVARELVAHTATKPAPRIIKKKTVTTIVPVRRSDPNGLPDLSVKVLEVRPVAGGKVAVKFEVSNLGTKLVNGWTFAATLPTKPTYTYVSEAQGTLYAGERAEMLITFDKLKRGTNSLLITVDAQNAILETVETNNAVIQSIIGK
jgi:hypothetical protein